MPTIETSLSATYQPTLTAIWALREIGSNAIDGAQRYKSEGRGELSFDYDPYRQRLTVSNKGVTVPSSALLMGTSQARQEAAAIGQFGEGLPMALLVLARLGLSVTIHNGIDRWSPAIRFSESFGSPVLVIETRRMRKDRGRFSVEINGVSPEQYDQFCSLFLTMDEGFDSSLSYSADSGEKVLLQERYRGKIYSKGVFVCRHEELAFGYDLQAPLNRDRSMMRDADIQSYAIETLFSVHRDFPENVLRDVVLRLMDNPECMEVRDRYSSLAYSDTLQRTAVELFKERYGENALASSSEADDAACRSLGRKGVQLDGAIGYAVRRVLGSPGDILVDRENEIVSKDVELSGDQEKSLALLRALIKSAYGKSTKIEPVTFVGKSTKVTYNEDTKVIRVAVEALDEFGETLPVVCDAARAVHRDWSGNITDTLAHMLQSILFGGDVELSTTLLAYF